MGKNSQSYTYFCFPILLTNDTLHFFTFMIMLLFLSKKTLPNPEWQWCHLCFPKGLYFKIFDSLSFNFSVIWDMNESYVLYMNTQLFQNYCSKVYKFVIDLSLHLCQNCFFINIWVCFLTLYFVLSIYLSSLTPIPHCFNYGGFYCFNIK